MWQVTCLVFFLNKRVKTERCVSDVWSTVEYMCGCVKWTFDGKFHIRRFLDLLNMLAVSISVNLDQKW
ncbi:hypothetical protein A2U01_0070056, partial [Trifolium medium]|nr:hypothetical protein [Trifolium medium]